jgi:hypothetical protein
MCRWMAWSGQPMMVEELLFKPAHGLVDQTTAAIVPRGGEVELRPFRPTA